VSDDRDIAHIDDLQNAIAGHRPDLSPTRLAEHGRWCGSQKQDFDNDNGSFTARRVRLALAMISTRRELRSHKDVVAGQPSHSVCSQGQHIAVWVKFNSLRL
jgi:hypothetical protein